MLIDKVFIGNAQFSSAGFPEVLDVMRSEIERREHKRYAAVTNIHVMVLMERDPDLVRVVNGADVCFCDSLSVVALGKREGQDDTQMLWPGLFGEVLRLWSALRMASFLRRRDRRRR